MLWVLSLEIVFLGPSLVFLRLTENSYFEIKFFEIDLVAKKFFFDFEFSVSLFFTNQFTSCVGEEH